MPTEKNAAFLPMQYGFKLDRQRVKEEFLKMGLVYCPIYVRYHDNEEITLCSV